MNRDPLDQLDHYYSGVHHAELPPSLTQPTRRSHLWIPLSGLAFGASLAIVIALIPPAPTAPATNDIARSIAERQLPADNPAPQRRSDLEVKTWGV